MRISYLIILILLSINSWSQSPITESDIAIRSQLTIVKVAADDLQVFESSLTTISSLAKKNELAETYDWLTYKTAPGQFLFITFSIGLNDLLTIESYKRQFSQSPDSLEFKKALDNLGACGIQVEDNHILEMILPWSTVSEISASVHPNATMSVFNIRPNSFEQFDQTMRDMVTLLKEVDYPFPLESNRGGLGAYGSVALVWFYNKTMTQNIYDDIEEWMMERDRLTAWSKYMKAIEEMKISRKDWHPRFQKDLSY